MILLQIKYSVWLWLLSLFTFAMILSLNKNGTEIRTIRSNPKIMANHLINFFIDEILFFVFKLFWINDCEEDDRPVLMQPLLPQSEQPLARHMDRGDLRQLLRLIYRMC